MCCINIKQNIFVHDKVELSTYHRGQIFAGGNRMKRMIGIDIVFYPERDKKSKEKNFNKKEESSINWSPK